MSRQPYLLLFDYRVEKEVRRLPPKVQRQVGETLLRLVETLGGGGRPQDMRKLIGGEDEYRIDTGEYRIVFWLDNAARTVTVNRIRHRRDVYRP